MRRTLNLTAWLFLAPALAAIGVFFVMPVCASLLLSFTDFDIYTLASWQNLRWVGWQQYSTLVRDPLFWRSLWNTLTFVAVGGSLTVIAALVAAVAVSAAARRVQGALRTMMFLPVVTTVVAAAVVWRAWYHPRVGLANVALRWVGLPAVDWLGDPQWALPAIMLFSIWKNFGFHMVIFIAALQSIPERLYEAAAIDGATKWQQFRFVTLPMLTPALAFVTLITVIGAFQVFAEPYVMTQGGPANATMTLVLFMYRNGFQWWNVGYGAAGAWVLFALLVVVTFAMTRLRARSEWSRT
ncbi:MAG: sugar ABC transporter permease [Candidatus Binatia bacterium]|nr:MAG: sugar ABC transporter permease [Candidatus Binatia bacterium]